MQKTYSIVEARNNFAALVHDAEETHTPIRVTRRGQSVVVVLSVAEYERLSQPKEDNWLEAYNAWRTKWDLDHVEIDPDKIWCDVRDTQPAEESDPWR